MSEEGFFLNAGMAILLTAVPEGRVFGLDQQALISIGIQLFNAALLAAVLSYVLYKPVRKFLRSRTERISALLGRAEGEMAKAGELKAQYEQKLEGIEEERAAILEAAHRLAAEKGRRILSDAQKDAAETRERALADTRIERERAQEEIRLQIIEVASIMAEKYVAQAMDAETQDRLFAETMAELEGAAWQE